MVKHKMHLQVVIPGTNTEIPPPVEGGATLNNVGHARGILISCNNPVRPYFLRDGNRGNRNRQPRYFDEYQKAYRKLAVLKSKIKVIPDPAFDDDTCTFGLFRTENKFPGDGQIISTPDNGDFLQWIDFTNPSIIKEQFSIGKPVLLPAASPSYMLKSKYDARTHFGIKFEDVLENSANSKFEGPSGTPRNMGGLREVSWMIYLDNLDKTREIQSMALDVYVTYYCLWSDPADVTLSSWADANEDMRDDDLDNAVQIDEEL